MTDPDKAAVMARRIIAERPQSDPNVVWAHNLLGLIPGLIATAWVSDVIASPASICPASPG